jgi:hypothetical protein
VTGWHWLLLGLGVTLVVYAALLVRLVLAGRRRDRACGGDRPPRLPVPLARAPARSRVPTRRTLLVGALLAYLAMPLDLIPDFIPIAGQLDDAIVVALVLRSMLRSGGPEPLREHGRGPQRGLDMLLRSA